MTINIGLENGMLLSGNKPLPIPILIQIYLVMDPNELNEAFLKHILVIDNTMLQTDPYQSSLIIVRFFRIQLQTISYPTYQ